MARTDTVNHSEPTMVCGDILYSVLDLVIRLTTLNIIQLLALCHRTRDQLPNIYQKCGTLRESELHCWC
jgi:hypothetical protein